MGFIKKFMLMNNIISTQFCIIIDAIQGPISRQKGQTLFISYLRAKNIRLLTFNHVHLTVNSGGRIRITILMRSLLKDMQLDLFCMQWDNIRYFNIFITKYTIIIP